MNIHGAHSYWNSLEAGVRRVLAGAGPQRAAYRGGGDVVRPRAQLVYHFIRLDALALSVIATATWLAGWVAGCPSQPVLYQDD